MTPDLPLLLAHRNARLRAWRALGLPFEEKRRWVRGDGWRAGVLSLAAKCLECENWTIAEARYPHFRDEVQVRCTHLDPLFGPDPECVRALTALELLAGDPPR